MDEDELSRGEILKVLKSQGKYFVVGKGFSDVDLSSAFLNFDVLLLKAGEVKECLFVLEKLRKNKINFPVILILEEEDGDYVCEALNVYPAVFCSKKHIEASLLSFLIDKVYRCYQMEERNRELQDRVSSLNKQLSEANKNLLLYTKELIRSEKMAWLLFFVRGISQQLNNPLGGIMGYTRNLLNRIEPDSPIREDLEEIQALAKSLQEVISKLALFCGRERRKSPVFPLRKTVEEMLHLFMPLAEKRGIEVTFSHPEDEIILKGLSVDFQQALMPILINAAESMEKGGKLRIECHREGDMAVICIRDEGVGIEEEPLEKIFSPFYSRGKGREHRGMGLTIAYGIIKEMKGEIKVQSKKGEGTTFCILLPVN